MPFYINTNVFLIVILDVLTLVFLISTITIKIGNLELYQILYDLI